MIKKLIKIEKLSKTFFLKNSKNNILKNINIELFDNSIISIMGPSGSGKSTLLNIIGLLDSNYTGSYYFLNENVFNFNNNKKNLLRNKLFGFVHQFFYLIPELTILENIALPKMIKTNNKNESVKSATSLIKNFGLENRINYKPLDLSGGEQQRVAIARALINKPKIIIADEMTGNLDEENSDLIFEFFLREIKKNNQSLIFATHNEKYANKADFKYKISKKEIIKK